MRNKLSHLSNKQVDELISRYYQGEKVKDLIREYKIKTNQLVNCFPPEITTNKCIYCEVNLHKDRVSRDASPYRNVVEKCPYCNHKESEFCYCENCSALRRSLTEEQRMKNQELLNILLAYDENSRIDLAELTFADRVYLGALLRQGISEDYESIFAIDELLIPLAPTEELTLQIINRLVDISAIVVHPFSNHDFINITDDNEISYQIDKVRWYLNIKSEVLNKNQIIETLVNPNQIDDQDFDEALLIWKSIALYECIEYLQYSVDKTLKIDYKIGAKTRTVFKDLIKDFSVSQIYGIIYKTTNGALRFIAEQGANQLHASNSIVGNSQSYAERARINNWDLVKYNRTKECPQSALSKFLYERVIKVGFDGFNEVPSLDKIITDRETSGNSSI